ncbi:unnamed protein product, partial [Dibothriocephalus latus]
SALYDFIKEYLIPTVGDFQLFLSSLSTKSCSENPSCFVAKHCLHFFFLSPSDTTPPKVNIPNNSTTTLVEANLVPMTKVHLTLPSGPPKAADVFT